MKKARQLDPTSLIINTALGQFYYFSGQQFLAIEQLEKTLEFDSSNDRVIFYYGLALAQSQRYAEAIDALKKLPNIPNRGGYEGGNTGQAGLAYVFSAYGQNSES